MSVITDEYRNLRAFLLERPSTPLAWTQAQTRWRQTHPDIARLFERETEEIARLFAAFAPPIVDEEKEDE